MRIRGRITGPDGSSLAGAILQVELKTELPCRRLDPVRSDEHGRYTIDLLRPPRTVSLAIETAVFADGFLPIRRTDFVSPTDAELVRDIELRRGGIVTGRILDDRQAPIERAVISVQPRSGEDFFGTGGRTWSGVDGRFILEVVGAESPVRVIASAHGYLSRVAASPVELGHDVGDMVLRPGLSIRGILQISDGTPVPDAVIAISDQRSWGDFAVVRTDEYGRFECDGLDAGQCSIRLESWVGTGEQPVLVVAAGDQDVRFEVDGDQYRFQIQDRLGKPIVGARCWARETGRTPSGRRPRVDQIGSRVVFVGPTGRALLAVACKADFYPAEIRLRPARANGRVDDVLVLVPRESQSRLELRFPGIDESVEKLSVSLLTPIAGEFIYGMEWWADGDDRYRRRAPVGRCKLVIEFLNVQAPSFFAPLTTVLDLSANELTVVNHPMVRHGRIRLRVSTDDEFILGFNAVAVREKDGVATPIREFWCGGGAGLQWQRIIPTNRLAVARPVFKPGRYTIRIRMDEHEGFEVPVLIAEEMYVDVVAEMVRRR